MTKTGLRQLLKSGRYEILLAILVGSAGYGLSLTTGASYADPLVIALIFGILVRTTVGDRRQLRHGFELASAFFIPVGIVFYAMKNLNFDRLARVDTAMLILLLLVVLVYFAVILILGRLTGQRRQITYLTATGSAICSLIRSRPSTDTFIRNIRSSVAATFPNADSTHNPWDQSCSK